MSKAGVRLKSAVCEAEIMIIKIDGADDITCGGLPMLTEAPDTKQEGNAEHMYGCLIGKRYVNVSER